jgi:glyoxylase-like metal-dependent hydrolase (beta-lactamase superfamily II)
MDAYLASLQAMADLDPKLVLPAHGPPLPGTSLLKTLAHRHQREERITSILADASFHTLADIATVAYADAPDTTVGLGASCKSAPTWIRLIRPRRRGAVGRRAYRIPGTSIMS